MRHATEGYPHEQQAEEWQNYPQPEGFTAESGLDLVVEPSLPATPEPKPRFAKAKRAATVAVAAGAALGASFALVASADRTHSGAQPVQEGQPVPVQVQEVDPPSKELSPEEAEAEKTLRTITIDLARGVATILQEPGSGGESYAKGTTFGNKSAVIGPDLMVGTKDDETDAPESFLFIEDDVIGFNSVQMFTTNPLTGEHLDDTEFVHVFGTFEVKGDVLDQFNGKKLTPSNFQEILSEHPDNLSLRSLDVQPLLGAQYEIKRDVLGELGAKISNWYTEDTEDSFRTVAQGDPDFKETLLRAADAAEDALLNLQVSWEPKK